MSCAGCEFQNSEQNMVTLLDGTVVCSSCEAWRHETEARALLGPSYNTQLRREYLNEVEKQRGKEAAEGLRLTILELWERRKAGQPLHGKVA